MSIRLHRSSDPAAPKRFPGLLTLALLVSLLMTFWSQSPHLWDRYRVENDVQNYYWMARYWDPDLFATDYMLGRRLIDVDVLGLRLILYPRSLGYNLLFCLPSLVIDYVWLSKLLVFFLMPLCVVYLFKLGRLIGDRWTGLALSMFFAFFILASPRYISIATGVPRAFAVPLLIVFLYCLISERYTGAGLMVLMSVLFYLPNFPLAALTYALSLVKVKRPFKLSLSVTRSKLLPLTGGLLLSALVVALALAINFEWLPSSMTAAPSFDVGKDTPSSQDSFYHSQGYAQLFISFLLVGRAGVFDMGTDVVNFLVLSVLGALVYLVVGSRSLRRLPGVCWRLLLAGAIMYAASLFTLLGLISTALYYPSRYTRSVLFLVALCYVGLNWREFLKEAPAWLRKNPRLLIVLAASFGLVLVAVYVVFPSGLLMPLLMLLGLVVVGVSVPLLASGLLWSFRNAVLGAVGGGKRLKRIVRFIVPAIVGLTVVFLGVLYVQVLGFEIISPVADPPAYVRELYEFAHSLPKDAVLAGDPHVMAAIPLFSQRSILFSSLQPSIRAPILDFFDAYYAESPEVVLEFCGRYGISHLVVNTAEFTPEYLDRGGFL